MPNISFERSMNHNYMILGKCSFFGKNEDQYSDYRTKMLLENRIPGLLPVTHRLINGESRYYYEINSLQSLDRLYDKAEIRYNELRQLLTGCVNLFDRLEEYLLDGTQIIIRPEMIYIEVEKMEPYFVCYPDYEGDVRISFMEFIDGLLTRIDHTDERAVMLGYQIYRYTRNPNYVISEIGNMMGHVIVDMARREAVLRPNDLESARDGASESGWDSDLERGICQRENPAGQAGMSDKAEVRDQEDWATYACEDDDISPCQDTGHRTKNIGDLIGGIFCIFVSLCSGAIILGARLIRAFELGGNSELYLYGAMGMAVAAAVLFFSCYIKKRRQDREAQQPDEDEECEDIQYYTAAGKEADHRKSNHFQSANPVRMAGGQDPASGNRDNTYYAGGDFRIKQQKSCETVYLGAEFVEERMLLGRMNGREVNISLERLPMTVGKLADVSDFVINDAAVSKMHARFEEHDGRVYVCDLNSTNGTVKNGVLLEVNQSVVLEPGDTLRFGRTCFTYC